MTKFGCRNGAANWAEWSGVPFGRAGCLGASQSSGHLNENFSGPEVWLGGGCLSARRNGTRRNGGQVDAEWRLPSLVTTSGVQRNGICGIQKPMAKANRKKAEATQPKPEKTDWVNDVLEKWGDASDKNDCDPLGLNAAPAWVVNAWIECCQIVIPGGLPTAGNWDAKSLGTFLGRSYGLTNLYAGEVPLGPETQAEKEKIEAAAKKLPPLKNAKALEKHLMAKFTAIHEAIPRATAAATSASYQDAMNFQKGLARGIEIKPDELATSRTFERHTRTYFVLALHWRTWMTCKSLREVHRHLCKAVGEPKIGSFKTFEKLCKKIKFKLRGRGRPKAAK